MICKQNRNTEQIHQAILDGYRSKNDLQQMVRFKLDEKLDEIVPTNDSLSAIVLSLIEWCESKGKIAELINGAYDYNPGNTKLQEIYRAFSTSSFSESEYDLKSKINDEFKIPKAGSSRSWRYQAIVSAIVSGVIFWAAFAGALEDTASFVNDRLGIQLPFISPTATPTVHSNGSYQNDATIVDFEVSQQAQATATATTVGITLTPTDTPAVTTSTATPILTQTPAPSPTETDTPLPTTAATLIATNTSIPASALTIEANNPLTHGIESVQITDILWIDKYETTNAEYRKCVRANVCTEPQSLHAKDRLFYFSLQESQYDDYPVIFVTQNQAETYCKFRGKRLPTEAEWILAANGCKADAVQCLSQRVYPWGNEVPTCERANYFKQQYSCNGKNIAPIGKYPDGMTRESGASYTGAIDMAGNVWEWTATCANGWCIAKGGDWGSSSTTLDETILDQRIYTVKNQIVVQADDSGNGGIRCIEDK